jgi:hypothetical protein
MENMDAFVLNHQRSIVGLRWCLMVVSVTVNLHHHNNTALHNDEFRLVMALNQA